MPVVKSFETNGVIAGLSLRGLGLLRCPHRCAPKNQDSVNNTLSQCIPCPDSMRRRYSVVPVGPVSTPRRHRDWKSGQCKPGFTFSDKFILILRLEFRARVVCVSFTFKILAFCSCAMGRQWCGVFHYHRWTASIKLMLVVSQCQQPFLNIFLYIRIITYALLHPWGT